MNKSTTPHLHTYRVKCSWTGSTAVGYELYDRTHTMEASPALTSLTLSSDPAFRGDPSKLNPEQLLVMAASSCQLLSFLAVAARARLNVIEYHDDAEAEMPEDDLPVRITTIKLRPRILIEAGSSRPSIERIKHLVEVAHKECYISNSLKTDIIVEPVIEIQESL
jgi:organic hydroperoxide reductase OsmC/OhrA